MGKIKEILFSKAGLVVIIVFICLGLGASDSKDDEIKQVQSKMVSLEGKLKETEEQLNQKKDTISELESKNKSLQEKVDKAEPWFKLKEEERQAQIAKAEQEKAEAEAKARAEAEEAERIRKEKEEAEAKKGYDTGITYENLARTPDDYEKQKIKFYGEVIQVMEGETGTAIRLSVENDYNKVMYCLIPKGTTSKRILEDDFITAMGISGGLYTYTSTIGGNITIPLMIVDKVEM